MDWYIVTNFRKIVVLSFSGLSSEYLLGLSTLKMAALRAFETLPDINQLTRCHILRDLNFYDLILLGRKTAKESKSRSRAQNVASFIAFRSGPLTVTTRTVFVLPVYIRVL
jgi:hypothetical protein